MWDGCGLHEVARARIGGNKERMAATELNPARWSSKSWPIRRQMTRICRRVIGCKRKPSKNRSQIFIVIYGVFKVMNTELGIEFPSRSAVDLRDNPLLLKIIKIVPQRPCRPVVEWDGFSMKTGSSPTPPHAPCPFLIASSVTAYVDRGGTGRRLCLPARYAADGPIRYQFIR